MPFNSIHFLLFFPVVVGLYFLLPHKYQWLLLLAASYYFYMFWNPSYAILILAVTIAAYIFSLLVHRTDSPLMRALFLTLNVLVSLSILFVFKYFNFFNDILRSISVSAGFEYSFGNIHFLLPVGISFYTFQALSYSIDVYRRRQKVERNFGILSLYVAFFPQLLAGPIQRAKHLLPQFYEKHQFHYHSVVSGLRLMLWGLFKKIVVADRLGTLVNGVYDAPASFTGMQVIIASFLFSFQIYADFSGYSDIAIGSARVLGFDLARNFDAPYFSKSLSEFWRRWHISLSSWLRDYVYVSLGGNRGPRSMVWRNLLIVFILCGLWHGAAWSFVVWGVLHGAFLIMEDGLSSLRICRTNPWRATWVCNMTRRALVFSFVTFAWIFFRAGTMSNAMDILSRIPVGLTSFCWGLLTLKQSAEAATLMSLGMPLEMTIASAAIIIMTGVELGHKSDRLRTFVYEAPCWLRFLIYYVLIMLILVFGNYEGSHAFIYFQF